MRNTILALLLLGVLGPGQLWAEMFSVVSLKDGKIVEGKIIEQSDKLLKIDTGIGTPVIVYVDAIDHVTHRTAESKPKMVAQQKNSLKEQLSEQPKFDDGNALGSEQKGKVMAPQSFNNEGSVYQRVDEAKKYFEEFTSESRLQNESLIEENRKRVLEREAARDKERTERRLQQLQRSEVGDAQILNVKKHEQVKEDMYKKQIMAEIQIYEQRILGITDEKKKRRMQEYIETQKNKLEAL